MKVKIDIETKTFVRFWLVVIGFAFAILALYLAQTAIIIVLSALFLALALSYPVGLLTKYLPGKNRVLGTAIAFTTIVGFIGMVIFLVIPPIATQTAKLVEAVPRMVSEASVQWRDLGDVIDKYNIQPQIDSAVESMRKNSASWLTNAGGNVVSSLSTFLANLAAIILTLVISFLMLIEGPKWFETLWGLYSDKKRMKRHRRVLTRMHRAVSGYVTGQLSVSAIGAFVAGLTVLIISFFVPEVPQNLALPAIAIMFLLSLIPMFGTTMAAVLLALLLALNNLPAGIIFLAAFFAYQQIENNIVYPAVQAKFVNMSALSILVSVTIGIYLFGLAGAVISIPVAGMLKVLFEEYVIHKDTTKKAPVKK